MAIIHYDVVFKKGSPSLQQPPARPPRPRALAQAYVKMLEKDDEVAEVSGVVGELGTVARRQVGISRRRVGGRR